jgi:hypothetical protein
MECMGGAPTYSPGGLVQEHSDRPAWLRALAGLLAAALALAFQYPWILPGWTLHLDWPWEGFLTVAVPSSLFFIGALIAMPLVSYRRRDSLLVLIPFYAIYLAGRVGFRLANLPARDWPPRPDENAARQLQWSQRLSQVEVSEDDRTWQIAYRTAGVLLLSIGLMLLVGSALIAWAAGNRDCRSDTRQYPAVVCQTQKEVLQDQGSILVVGGAMATAVSLVLLIYTPTSRQAAKSRDRKRAVGDSPNV